MAFAIADFLWKVRKNLGFPSQLNLINEGVNGHTPHMRASLEPGTSGFSPLYFNHYSTRGVRKVDYAGLDRALSHLPIPGKVDQRGFSVTEAMDVGKLL